MSPKFLRLIRKELKCPHCANAKANGKSVCPDHLEYARAKWQIWSIERREQGKCCYCEKKSYKGQLRCEKHAEYNREKCKAWMKVHSHEQWEKVKNFVRETGLCYKCKAHNPVIPGTFWCEGCRERARNRNRKG